MNLSGRKILVLGGTGAMGMYLVPMLANMGCTVHVTSRKPHASNNSNIVYLLGNAKDDQFIDSCLSSGYDAIVDFMIYNTGEFKARYERMLASTEHYLFLSSYRVYADAKSAPITEESPRLLETVKDSEFLATDEYSLTKARQEDILKSAPTKNWTILRPAITYASNRFQLGTMECEDFVYRALAGKTVIFPKEMLDKETTMTWGGDVARMISLLILNENAYGEIFTLSTSEHHKWKEVIQYYRKILGLQVKTVNLKTYQEVTKAAWRVKYDRMLNRIVDNSKVLKATGMRQEDLMPLYDGLKIELANFAQKPKYGNINRNLQKRMDDVTHSERKGIFKKLKKAVAEPRKAVRKCKQKLKKILKRK